MQTAVIDAGMVQLALVTQKMRTRCRWAAMSAHVVTADCRRRSVPSYRLPMKSVAQPMSRGDMSTVVKTVRSQGRREVMATFGIGVRAIEAEIRSYVMEA